MMKNVLLFLIMMLISACQSDNVNCCPITSGRIENPQKVRDYIANDEIFVEFLKKCACNL